MSNIKVKDISYSKHLDEETGWSTSRIIIGLTDTTKYDIFQLSRHPRVVVDFKEADLAKEGVKEVTVKDGIVKTIRWSQFLDGVVRVVMDLEIQGRCSIVKLGPDPSNQDIKERLVIDIQQLYLKIWDHVNKKLVTQTLNDYLIGVIAAEMPANFNQEALKCQAVIARTNVLRVSKIFGGQGLKGIEGADISSDSGKFQGWLDKTRMVSKWGTKYEEYHSLINKIVQETENKVLLYDNHLIEAVFHSTCGGSTLSSIEVWGRDIPYLQSQKCDYCKIAPYWSSTREVSIEEINDKLGVNFNIPFNPHYTPGGKLDNITIGGKVFSGDELRAKLGTLSAKITIDVKKINIISKGYGHGVGVCQYGAEGLARSGKKYDEILKFYYKGVVLVDKDIVPIPAKPSVPPVVPLKGKTIVVDPGHGGKDPGAVGYKGLQEKEVVLTISLTLKKLLEDAGAKVILTRDVDTFIPLPGRVNLANKNKAQIFVAIHNNSATADSARGLETYYYTGSIKGMKLASCIQKQLVNGLQWPDRKIKTAGFYVIRYTDMPACLVEVGFVSNNIEGNWLAPVVNRQQVAQLIYKGILDFFK